jgi:radical SAM superfamily enzyme YgiQ (UPF0313 family)
MWTRSARLASAYAFGYSAGVRPQTVVVVEPPYVCWDREMDRVREGEEEIPGVGTLTLARFLAEGFGFTWSCNSHPNLLDLDTLRLMRRAGCWQTYGSESGSQRVLDVVKQEVKLPRMLETLPMTRAAGIRVTGLLMMGHPTKDEDSLRETVEFLRHAPLDLMQIKKFTPYPGTPSYGTLREYGAFVEDWERMNAMQWVFVARGLRPETLERWFGRAFRTFYSRPDVLWGLGRTLLGEPRFVRRVSTYVRVGVGEWLLSPLAPARA